MPRLFDIFRRKKEPETTTELVVTGRSSAFTTYGTTDPYANDVFRAGVDAIARIAAKFVLQPTATFSDGTTATCDKRLTRVLQVRPNEYQTAYDALYMLYTHLYVNGNAYAYLYRDARGQVIGLYPLHVKQCRFMEDSTGTIYAAMMFANGKSYVAPYRDIVHLRRFQNGQDINGEGNDAISAAVSLAEAQNTGVEASIRTAGRIKGVVKYKGALGDTNKEALMKAFEQTYFNIENSGGIIPVDSTYEYVPFETRELPPITAEDQEVVKSKIFSYLGISESIVNGSFDDDTFSAFEESTIEALALQTALEFTAKVYPDSPNRHIECQTSRIRYIGQEHKTDLLKHLLPMGLMSINEGRDLLGMAPIEGGERRIQSLNYIDAEIASKYQLVRSGQGIKALLPDTEGADNDK